MSPSSHFAPPLGSQLQDCPADKPKKAKVRWLGILFGHGKTEEDLKISLLSYIIELWECHSCWYHTQSRAHVCLTRNQGAAPCQMAGRWYHPGTSGIPFLDRKNQRKGTVPAQWFSHTSQKGKRLSIARAHTYHAVSHYGQDIHEHSLMCCLNAGLVEMLGVTCKRVNQPEP